MGIFDGLRARDYVAREVYVAIEMPGMRDLRIIDGLDDEDALSQVIAYCEMENIDAIRCYIPTVEELALKWNRRKRV